MACNLCGRTHETQEEAQRCAAYELMLDQIPFIDPPELLDRQLRRRRTERRREPLKQEDQNFVTEYRHEVRRFNDILRQRNRPVRSRWWGDDPPDFEGGIRVPRRPRRPSGYPGVAMEVPTMDQDRFESFQATWTDTAESRSLNKGWKKAG